MPEPLPRSVDRHLAVFSLFSEALVHAIEPALYSPLAIIQSLVYNSDSVAKFVNSDLPGFEPFHTFGYGADIIQDVIKLKVTPALGKGQFSQNGSHLTIWDIGTLTQALSEETSLMLKDSWTDSKGERALMPICKVE